ncbi:MAG: glycosyl transferase [Thermoanaerobaculia bacterium]
MPQAIAVIVPIAAGEAAPPAIFFETITGSEAPVSLVAAADSKISANVREAFARAGARLHLSPAPRGQRMREAASSSSEEILLFLHTDTILPFGWEEAVRRAIASGAAGGAFRLAFSGGGARMRWVAFWANARTAFTRAPYGDQAPFVQRDVYARLLGHKSWPLLEDVDFATRLKREGPVALLSAAVQTSPRRYLERGVLRTVLVNWRTLFRFRRGVSPERLAEEYRK